MRYSFHEVGARPEKLPDGRFNCSGQAVYETFRQHVDCNMLEECVDGRDETDCSYRKRAGID
jgi:hypothetical protein